MKLTKDQAANLPGWVVEEIESGEGDYKSARMVKGATKVSPSAYPDRDEYFYRGIKFYQFHDVPSGYSGRWKVGRSRHDWKGFDTIEECLDYIDKISA